MARSALHQALNFLATKVAKGESIGLFACFDPQLKPTFTLGWGKTESQTFPSPQTPTWVLSDHQANLKSFTFTHTLQESDPIPNAPEFNRPSLNCQIQPLKTEVPHFIERVKKLQEHQRQGEAWVANLCHDFCVKTFRKIEPLDLVKIFQNFIQQKDYFCGGILISKEQTFCSLSPEIFIAGSGKNLATFPIKGTGSKDYLEASAKEASELDMVTDLLRNDLGQIANRVGVSGQREISAEGNFFHARSVIKATLRKPLNQTHFQRLLPAGSVTGSPKRRVVEITNTLEDFDREFFTGTFGVNLPNGDFCHNVLIRTLFQKSDGNFHFPVGAGITVESDPKNEWQELLAKQQIFLKCANW